MTQDRLFPASAMPDRDWWHTLWPNPDRVVRALRIGQGMTVIDLGCGDGYFTAAIARQVLGQQRGPKTEMRMSPEQTRTMVEPAGFKLETRVELPPYHYGAIFIRITA